jgi:hypothetical protein
VLRWLVASAVTLAAFAASWWLLDRFGARWPGRHSVPLAGDVVLTLAAVFAAVVAAPLAWWAGRDRDGRTAMPDPVASGTGQVPATLLRGPDGNRVDGRSSDAGLVVGDVPLPPPAFQERRGLLTELRAAAGSGRPAVVCALTGARGVGKTQAAATYARECAAAGFRLVAWVSAEDEPRVLAGLDRLGDALGLRGPDEDSETVAGKVRRWLEACAEPCLVVFDNATDPQVLRRWLPGAGRV